MDGLSLCVPSFASMLTISIPVMLERALTLCMWILCEVQYILCTIVAMSNLLGWWCYDDWCRMWLFMRVCYKVVCEYVHV